MVIEVIETERRVTDSQTNVQTATGTERYDTGSKTTDKTDR